MKLCLNISKENQYMSNKSRSVIFSELKSSASRRVAGGEGGMRCREGRGGDIGEDIWGMGDTINIYIYSCILY